jgi:hypothetical protein
MAASASTVLNFVGAEVMLVDSDDRGRSMRYFAGILG